MSKCNDVFAQVVKYTSNQLYSIFLKGDDIPSGFGLFLLPFSKEFGHHQFGAVTWVERPKIFGFERHFVTFNGQTETENHEF